MNCAVKATNKFPKPIRARLPLVTAGTWNDNLVRLAFARHQKPITDVEKHGVDAWVVGNI